MWHITIVIYHETGLKYFEPVAIYHTVPTFPIYLILLIFLTVTNIYFVVSKLTSLSNTQYSKVT